jgi:hypothetical protein
MIAATNWGRQITRRKRRNVSVYYGRETAPIFPPYLKPTVALVGGQVKWLLSGDRSNIVSPDTRESHGREADHTEQSIKMYLKYTLACDI